MQQKVINNIKSKPLSAHQKWRRMFFWLYWFYPKARAFHPFYLLWYFFPQKVLRINGRIDWPVHFTSSILFHKNIKLGQRCAPGMSAGCYIQARNGIVIGNNFRMGPGVGLISSNHRLEDYDDHIVTDPIRIGNNVWIGMNSVILPGVTIGNNVAIGANSVVNRAIPDNVIAAGNPCEMLKHKEQYQGVNYSETT